MSQTLITFGTGELIEDIDPNYLGGKGAGLCEMSNMGIPVPPGVIIPTYLCRDIGPASGSDLLKEVTDQVCTAITSIEKELGKPCLFSVRSGAPVSMPGMMDTILNVGINRDNISSFESVLGHRAAWDCYRRLIQMIGTTVFCLDSDCFNEIYNSYDSLAKQYIKEICDRFEQVIEDKVGIDISSMPMEEQLSRSIEAVCLSWYSGRAVEYRKHNKISDDMFTAVVVQAMVFGNLNDQSCSGVLFSRNPITGDTSPYGEYLVNAQGEDVVSGVVTPENIDNMSDWNSEIFAKLITISDWLEESHKDMQDIEFTVEDGKLWILQTRKGKRSANAAFRIAWDMLCGGWVTEDEALKRVTARQYLELTSTAVDPGYTESPTFTGIPASGSVVSGHAVFSHEDAVKAKGPVIFVSEETSPDDFAVMALSSGILTVTGGTTSHAAVVARGMDKSCVVGCVNLCIGENIKKDDLVTMDGATGKIWVNKDVPVVGGSVPSCAKELRDLGYRKYLKNRNVALEYVVENDKKADVVDVLETGKCVIDFSKVTYGKILTTNLTSLINKPDVSGILMFDTVKPVNSADLEFLNVLGVGDDQPVSTGTEKVYVKALLAARWPKMMMRRFSIRAESFSAESRELLRDRGWDVTDQINSVKELLTAEGAIEISDQLAKVIIDQCDVTIEEFVGRLNTKEKPVNVVPNVASCNLILFDVFGND